MGGCGISFPKSCCEERRAYIVLFPQRNRTTSPFSLVGVVILGEICLQAAYVSYLSRGFCLCLCCCWRTGRCVFRESEGGQGGCVLCPRGESVLRQHKAVIPLGTVKMQIFAADYTLFFILLCSHFFFSCFLFSAFLGEIVCLLRMVWINVSSSSLLYCT